MPQSRQNLPIMYNYYITFKFYIKITDDFIFDDVIIFPVLIGIFPPDFSANTAFIEMIRKYEPQFGWRWLTPHFLAKEFNFQ